jgi:ubiquinone/menaquinone biosynthesis C-methylase UbiE
MIENISIDYLYDEISIKIMDEIKKLREKQLNHSYKINVIGTNNVLFSILYSLSGSLKTNPKLKRITNYILRKILERGAKQGKTLQAYTKVFWTNDVVKSSTMPYPIRRTEYPWAVLNAKLDKPMKILDIGSGISLFPIYLASKGHEVYSIDNDEILMNRLSPELAKMSGVNVKYSFGNATKIEFDDESFDRVFCISTIEHLEEEYVDEKYVNYHKKNLDITAIGEMLRVLKFGGLLIMTFDWSEDKNELRSYKIDDIYDRVLKPYKKFLIKDEKLIIDWNDLKEKHVSAWKSFPPYNYVSEGWAIGTILKK